MIQRIHKKKKKNPKKQKQSDITDVFSEIRNPVDSVFSSIDQPKRVSKKDAFANYAEDDEDFLGTKNNPLLNQTKTNTTPKTNTFLSSTDQSLWSDDGDLFS